MSSVSDHMPLSEVIDWFKVFFTHAFKKPRAGGPHLCAKAMYEAEFEAQTTEAERTRNLTMISCARRRMIVDNTGTSDIDIRDAAWHIQCVEFGYTDSAVDDGEVAWKAATADSFDMEVGVADPKPAKSRRKKSKFTRVLTPEDTFALKYMCRTFALVANKAEIARAGNACFRPDHLSAKKLIFYPPPHHLPNNKSRKHCKGTGCHSPAQL
jgi:hypothetical protein